MLSKSRRKISESTQELGQYLQLELKKIDRTFIASQPELTDFLLLIAFANESQKIKKTLQYLIAYYSDDTFFKEEESEFVSQFRMAKLLEFAAIADLDDRWAIALRLFEAKETRIEALEIIQNDISENTLEHNAKVMIYLEKKSIVEIDIDLKIAHFLLLFELIRIKFQEQLEKGFRYLKLAISLLSKSRQCEKFIKQIAVHIPNAEEALEVCFNKKKTDLIDVISNLNKSEKTFNEEKIIGRTDRAFLCYLQGKVLIQLGENDKENKKQYLKNAFEKIKSMGKSLPPYSTELLNELQEKSSPPEQTDYLKYLAEFTENVSDARILRDHFKRISYPTSSEEKGEIKRLSNPGHDLLVKLLKKIVAETKDDKVKKTHLTELVELRDEESILELKKVESRLKYVDTQLKSMIERIQQSVLLFNEVSSFNLKFAETILSDLAELWESLKFTEKHQEFLIRSLSPIFKDEPCEESKSILPLIKFTDKEKIIMQIKKSHPQFVDVLLEDLGSTNQTLKFIKQLEEKLKKENLRSIEHHLTHQDYGTAASICGMYRDASRFPLQPQSYVLLADELKSTDPRLAIAYYAQAIEDFRVLNIHSEIPPTAKKALEIESDSIENILQFISILFDQYKVTWKDAKEVKNMFLKLIRLPPKDVKQFNAKIQKLISKFIYEVRFDFYDESQLLIDAGIFARAIGLPQTALQCYKKAQKVEKLFEIAEPCDEKEVPVDIRIAAHEEIIKISRNYECRRSEECLKILKREPVSQKRYEVVINEDIEHLSSEYNYENRQSLLRRYIEEALHYTELYHSDLYLENSIFCFLQNNSFELPNTYFSRFFEQCDRHLQKITASDPVISGTIDLIRARGYLKLQKSISLIPDLLKEACTKIFPHIETIGRTHADRLNTILRFLNTFYREKMLSEAIPALAKGFNPTIVKEEKEDKSALALIELTPADKVLARQVREENALAEKVVTLLPQKQKEDIEFYLSIFARIQKFWIADYGVAEAVKKHVRKGQIEEACEAIVENCIYRIRFRLIYGIDWASIIEWVKISSRLGDLQALILRVSIDNTVHYPLEYYAEVFDLADQKKSTQYKSQILQLAFNCKFIIPTTLFLKWADYLLQYDGSSHCDDTYRAFEFFIKYIEKNGLPYELSESDIPLAIKIYNGLLKNPLLQPGRYYALSAKPRLHVEREIAVLTQKTLLVDEKSCIFPYKEAATREKDKDKKTHLFVCLANHHLLRKESELTPEHIAEGVHCLRESAIIDDDFPLKYFKPIFGRLSINLRKGHIDPAVHFSMLMFQIQGYYKIGKFSEAIEMSQEALAKVSAISSSENPLPNILEILKNIDIKKTDNKSKIHEVIAKTKISDPSHQFSLLAYIITLVRQNNTDLRLFIEALTAIVFVPVKDAIHKRLNNDFNITTRLQYIRLLLSILTTHKDEPQTVYKKEFINEIKTQLELSLVPLVNLFELVEGYTELYRLTQNPSFLKDAALNVAMITTKDLSPTEKTRLKDDLDCIHPVFAELLPETQITLGNMLVDLGEGKLAEEKLFIPATQRKIELIQKIENKIHFWQVINHLIDLLQDQAKNIHLLQIILGVSKEELCKSFEMVIKKWFEINVSKTDPNHLSLELLRMNSPVLKPVKNSIVAPILYKYWLRSMDSAFFRACYSDFLEVDYTDLKFALSFIDNLQKNIWEISEKDKTTIAKKKNPNKFEHYIFLYAKEKTSQLSTASKTGDEFATFILVLLHLNHFKNNRKPTTKELTEIFNLGKLFLGLTIDTRIMDVAIRQSLPLVILQNCREIIRSNISIATHRMITSFKTLAAKETNVTKQKVLKAQWETLEKDEKQWESREESKESLNTKTISVTSFSFLVSKPSIPILKGMEPEKQGVCIHSERKTRSP